MQNEMYISYVLIVCNFMYVCIIVCNFVQYVTNLLFLPFRSKIRFCIVSESIIIYLFWEGSICTQFISRFSPLSFYVTIFHVDEYVYL
jgi:hypothetical protein